MTRRKSKAHNKPWGRSRGGVGGNEIRHWQCAECGKRSYRDRDAAKEAIRDMRRRGLARGAKIDPYLCHEGTGSWHVGHSSLFYEPPNLNDPHTYEVGA